MSAKKSANIKGKYSQKDVALRIRALRRSSGFTQQALADKLGISNRQLSYIESGERSLSVPNAEILVHLYSVSLDYIYFGSDANENADPIH